MGWLDNVLNRNKELDFMFDWELIEEKSRKIMLKQLATESVFGSIAKTVIQSEFKVKKDDKYVKDSVYYMLNVRPNRNQSKAEFLLEITYDLLNNGECLVVKDDVGNFLIADSWECEPIALYEKSFKNVVVDEYEFKRQFKREDVLYFKYTNSKIRTLMNGLYDDYGELIGRMIEFQLKKSQLRAGMKIDSTMAKDEKTQKQTQSFIDRTIETIRKNAVAVFPLQKGIEYEEFSKDTGTTDSIDDIKKLKNQYTEEVAKAVGYPVAFLRGDMADVEKITRNYLRFCIDPILEVIENEINRQFFYESEYLNGDCVEIKRVTYRDLFDLSTAIDKLVSSGAFTPNEIREESGFDLSDDEKMDEYYMTKNYQSLDELEGGDKE